MDGPVAHPEERVSSAEPRPHASRLRQDALRIWMAGVDAVRSDRLVAENISVRGDLLTIAGETFSLAAIGRIVVVGAGKAGAGMAAGVETALGSRLLKDKQVCGWINVPEGCEALGSAAARDGNSSTPVIHLHPARPAGVNEPTAAGVQGSREILRLVAGMGKHDLCICLLSGGGSALLPAPAEGVSLADKQQVTRHLSGAGANIVELNTVRKHLSQIKGGGLLRACRAGHLLTLVISDVMGDPLDVIASGPTVPDSSSAADALQVLKKYDAQAAGISQSVFLALEKNATRPSPTCANSIHVIGNNAVAVDAAGQEAERLGYSAALDAATQLEPEAETVGNHLAEMALRMRDRTQPDCLVTGGEPVVKLADPAIRGLGGRNQQLVLAALVRLAPAGLENLVLLAGGTDGEDGPTDAAGALIDAEVWRKAQQRGLDPTDFLRRNDAYHFFEPLGALIQTGPTHTNVCDLRVVLVSR